MLAILHLLVMFVADIFKSRRRVEAESLFLRHQLNIALRQAPPRRRLRGAIEIESTHTIEIDSFVSRSQIDQSVFDTPYYVTPSEPVGQEDGKLRVVHAGWDDTEVVVCSENLIRIDCVTESPNVARSRCVTAAP